MIFKRIALFIFVVMMSIIFLKSMVMPILQKHKSLQKNESILSQLELASRRIPTIIQENENHKKKLHDKLIAQSGLPFLQKTINDSHLVLLSMRSLDTKVCEELELAFRGSYGDFLQFLIMLGREPNAMEILSFFLDTNQFLLTVRDHGLMNCSKEEMVKKTLPAKKHSFIQRLNENLHVIRVPSLLSSQNLVLKNIQSPFSERKQSIFPVDIMQVLMGSTWCYAGEVLQKGKRVGVFLTTQGQSHYFGLGMRYEDSDWRVIGMDKNSVLFQNTHTQEEKLLFYRMPISRVFV